MIYLTRPQIILINITNIRAHGGNFQPPHNLLHPDRLDFVVEMVHHDLYYPSIYEKAALYMYNIIANHIFHDGNKRTGLNSALMFLGRNGFELGNHLSNLEIIRFAEGVADASIGYDHAFCAEWLSGNVIKAESGY